MKNNKLIKIMLLITVIAFIIISCGTKSALKNIETDEILIEVSYVGESFLKEYDTYDSFINDEDLSRIAFISNIPVKDFSWLYISINFDDRRDEFVYEIDEVLYSLKELHPKKPLVVSWTEVGMMSVFGFSYRDKDGQKKYFMGKVGNYGEDPEEYDGPAFIIGQFFPQEIVTGQYQYTNDETTLLLDLAETSYTLKVNDIVYTGTAFIDFGDVGAEKDSWYVILEGIKWAAWDKKAYSKPSGIFLWLEEGAEGNVLVYQNHGNPMTPYVIFGEIAEKFVTLTKVEICI
jgi:hypothetical protein